MQNSKKWLPSLLVFFATVISCRGLLSALFSGGLMSGHDAAAYPMIQEQFHENVLSGNWMPLWANRMQFGFGEPFLMFRPPVFSFLSEFWFLLTGHLFAAVNLACLTILVLAAWGMFLLAGRMFESRWLRALVASAYVLSPYIHVDLYVRGAYSELSVFAVYPFLVLSLWNLAEKGGRKHFVLSALFFSALSMSHSPVFFISTGFLILWGLFAVRSKKVWASLLGACSLGMALSAFYWIPLFTHRNDIKAALFSVGYEAFPGHFRTLADLLYKPWGFGQEYAMSYAAGVFAWLGFFGALLTGSFERSTRNRILFAAATLSLYFIHRTSALWYEIIPLLQPMSFPWRFLTVFTFVGALLGAITLDDYVRKNRTPFFVGTWVLLVLVAIPRSVPQSIGDTLARFTPELLESGWGFEKPTTSPTTAGILPKSRAYKPAETISGRTNGECKKVGATQTVCDLLVIQPSRVQFNTLDFPGWTVRLDGNAIPKITVPGSGLIQADVAPGKHTLILQLEHTSSRLFSKLVSLFTLLALVGLGLPFFGGLKFPKRS